MAKVLKKMRRNREDPLSELCPDTDWPSDFDGQLEDCISSEENESDGPSRKQKKNIIVSDNESDLEEEWTEKDVLRALEDYTNISGTTVQFEDLQSVSEVTSLFFDNDFFDLITSQTNIYHHQMENYHKIFAKTSPWTDITSTDIKKFLGLIVLMGLMKKPKWKDYWSTDPLLESPIFPKTMTRMRFEQILTFFHLNDNSQTCNTDRLYKVRPLLNHLSVKFKSLYIPKQQLSLNEAMIPWRGPIRFKTYNPAKIIKSGILVKMLRESESGYICNFEIYMGEGKNTILPVLWPFLGSWHHIYQDNYYNSMSTTTLLLKNKTLLCGTIRENFRLPKLLKEKTKSLQRGEMTFLRKGPIIILLTRKDKRPIHMISTIHNASTISTHNITKPTCLVDYNRYMKGVDRADQFLTYGSIFHKSIKWYKKVSFFLINCAFFNAFKIYCHNNQKNKNKMRYKNFLLGIAREWIAESSIECSTQPSTSPNTSKRAPMKDSPFRLTGKLKDHVLQKIVTSGKKNPTRACKVCSSKGKRSETRYVCKTCLVPLHVDTCFTTYHTKKKY